MFAPILAVGELWFDLYSLAIGRSSLEILRGRELPFLPLRRMCCKIALIRMERVSNHLGTWDISTEHERNFN